MSRIKEKFTELKRDGKKGFIPFVTAGDPNTDASLSILRILAGGGADIIEVGVPFSDPMADGPTIQASSQRALKNGAGLSDILDMIKTFRLGSDVPVVLFSYLNPLMQYGFQQLSSDAALAGIDGVLVTDVVDTEAAEIRQVLTESGLDLISLIAPTTSDERLSRICAEASGFIYAVSRAGVTGASGEVSSEAERLVTRARKFTDLPIAVGFGISTAEQINEVWQYADAAVVGSAIVAEIQNAGGHHLEKLTKFLARLLPPVAKSRVEI